ncbi:Hemoglobin-like protein (Hmp) [Cupriavidus necator]|uniref:Hemin receptor n=1 Tax=Cupriavidus necator (strain ATCC 17699 / DSM 428 / KCTC 22496 / NCIMB 10442 / H16 / Stanier 337) TaxID=381666 RepID=Q0K2N2_CUPNH|nr:globin family protein [Cupriavidus necator]QCC03634.1 hemin receptor [Cupriavidus necator H16]QQB80688.1 hemin receptor [Cupriavidus necator]WKA44978.1 globin family protein [Cupriavidus necator]CAJ95742.1 Hemoglobin-like protein (Hmp) [Cupriavidus necator H16]
MTPQEITLVQSSWQKVVPIKEKAAELFYGKLFEMDPSLRPLFKGDTVEQGRKLMAMINAVVTKLDQLDDIVPAVQELGRRHVAYGVKDEDYDTVAGALLWTLGAGLGDAFTDEVKGAWTSAYVILAGAMKDAAATAWD